MTRLPGKFARRYLTSVLGWLPIALLLAGFANHLWLVHRHQLSPWLGAGFGMFAATDVGSVRQVFLTVQLADGNDYPIDLEDPYRDTLERARGLPTSAWLSRLAAETFQALRETPDLEFPTKPLSLRIEVWRNRYARDTLQTNTELLTSAEFPFPNNVR